MQDLTPVVADDEKAVQNTKSERWDGEKVHRSNGLAMVSEERQPSLHRIWISRGSPDPSRDTPFGIARFQASFQEYRPDTFDKTLVAELDGGNVDGNGQWLQPRVLPGARLGACF